MRNLPDAQSWQDVLSIIGGERNIFSTKERRKESSRTFKSLKLSMEIQRRVTEGLNIEVV
jgi:hypothetical protein